MASFFIGILIILVLCQLVWVKKFYICNQEELSYSLSGLIPFIFSFKGVLVDD